MKTRVRSLTEEVLRGRNLALQELARGAPLETVLTTLCRSAENVIPKMRCSILVLDEAKRCLYPHAAPSLPPTFVHALDGLPVGPNVGCCGAAAFRKERVVAEDVLTHPNWTHLLDLARGAGIRACWSEPIFSSRREILGTLAAYYGEPHGPETFELDFIETTAHLAGIAIERMRDEALLRDSEERFRQLAENIGGAFWLTDWAKKEVLYISPAYENLWGRPCSSLHEDPQSWSYDIHPDDKEQVVAAYASAGEMPYDVEYRLIRPGGGIRWIHDRAFAIHDAKGRTYRMAGIAEDITDRKRVERELWEAHEELDARRMDQLKSLTSELLLAEERERRRIAQDLHDGLNQTISLAKMKLAQIRRTTDGEMGDSLLEIEELIERANHSARSLTFQLSPPILHDLGFEPAVQWLVEDIRSSYGLDIKLEEDGNPSPLDERVRVLLFRAVRELLINVAKHARASKAIVRLGGDVRMVRISVEDDGVAFDTSAVGSRGVGLRSIGERLNHLGGSMAIRSEPGEGTTVTLRAPLDGDERAAR